MHSIRSCLAHPMGITLFRRPARDTRFPQTALLSSQLRKQSLPLQAHDSQLSRPAWKYDPIFSRPSKRYLNHANIVVRGNHSSIFYRRPPGIKRSSFLKNSSCFISPKYCYIHLGTKNEKHSGAPENCYCLYHISLESMASCCSSL